MNDARRAGVLARVSLDRDGQSESPDQQIGDAHALAAYRGWEIVETYVERDVSGYKPDVSRPEYDRLIQDMETGRLDVVVVWAIDRLTRQGVVGISEFMKVMKRTKVELVSVTQQFVDTTTPIGEGVLALIASLAKQESENTSKRVKRDQRYAAKNGRRHTGGYRTYGYACPGRRRNEDGEVVCDLPGCPHDGESVIEREAAVIREAFDRVIAGETLWSICQDFNERGLRTSGAGVKRKRRGTDELYEVAGRWQTRTLSALLRNPVLAGIVQHDGERYPGRWKRILTPEEHEQVTQALALRPATRKRGDRHLLSGVIRCGLCDTPLKYMVMKSPNGSRFPRYQCVKQPGHQNCGKVAVTMRSTDDYVTSQLLDFLASVRLRPLDHEEDVTDLERLLKEAQEGLTELVHERFVRRTIQASDFESARAALYEQVEALEQRLAVAQRVLTAQEAELPLGDRDALARWWAAADHDDRRAALRQAFSVVTVQPARRRGGNKFDTSRLDIRWNWDRFIRRAERATPTPEAEAAYMDEQFEETQRSVDSELGE